MGCKKTKKYLSSKAWSWRRRKRDVTNSSNCGSVIIDGDCIHSQAIGEVNEDICAENTAVSDVPEENCSYQEVLPKNLSHFDSADTTAFNSDVIVASVPEVTEFAEKELSNDDVNVDNTREISKCAGVQLSGRRITDPLYFYNELRKMNDEHGFREQCSFHDIYSDRHHDNGLRTQIKFRCNICPYFKWIYLVENSKEIMSLNEASVAGTIITGTGYLELQQQLAAMAIPYMSDVSYRKYRQDLVSSFEEAANISMQDAVNEEKELAMKDGHVINGIPYITVITDGAWLKRSYKSGKFDSLSGCAVIIGYRTRKVLFVGVRNKCCSTCARDKELNRNRTNHRCFKNYGRDQNSSSMEKDIIVQGFSESIKTQQLIYKTIIGDGDSSVYKSILNNNPYRDYGVRVEKIECTNHLLRNMCNKIVEASRGKIAHSLAKGSVTPFRKCIKRSAYKIRQHIMNLIKVESNKAVFDKNIKNFQRQIINAVDHVFGDHKYCCRYKVPCDKKKEKNYVPVLKSSGFYNTIRQAVVDASCHANSFLHLTTNNYAESFNAIIAKVTGGKRVNYGMRDSYYTRVQAAVVQYNTQSSLTKLYEVRNFSPPDTVVSMEESMKKKIENKRTMRNVKGRKRKRHVPDAEQDYGESVNRPDVSPEAYSVLQSEHLKKLKDDQANRDEIERLTVNQSDSDMWHQKRSVLLTASNFGRICRKRVTTSCAQIVKSILYPPVLKLPALVYGKQNEETSRKKLEKVLNKEIKLAGLCIGENEEYLGASVDGYIDDDGIVELKNPITAHNLTPKQALKQKTCLRNIFSKEDVNKMNSSHIYYYQVQGQLHVTKRKYCIFAMCTNKGIKHVRVERDDKFWEEKMAGPLKSFYFDCLLPEILDSRFNRCMPIREPEYILQAQKKKEENNSFKNAKISEDSENTTKSKDASNESVSTDYLINESICVSENLQEYERTISEHGEILSVLYNDVDMNLLLKNIGSVHEMLTDDSIQYFLQIVQHTTSEFEIHPPIYYRYLHLLPNEFVGYNGKIHLQIIGGHENSEHWVCIQFDGINLLVFDSLNRGTLNSEETLYLSHRYPQLNWRNCVHFVKVTQQPDMKSCGIYAMAFMTDIVLKKNPVNVEYCRNTNIMRRHALTIIKRRQLFNFPFYNPPKKRIKILEDIQLQKKLKILRTQ